MEITSTAIRILKTIRNTENQVNTLLGTLKIT